MLSSGGSAFAFVDDLGVDHVLVLRDSVLAPAGLAERLPLAPGPAA